VTRVAVAAAAVVLVLTAFQLLLAIASELAHIILLIVFGVVIAFVLGPLVDMLERRLGRRSLAVLITAILAIGALVGSIALLAVPLVRETRALAADVPAYIAALSSDEPINVLGFEISGELRQRIGAEFGARAGEFSQQAARIALGLAGGIVDFVLVLVLGIYLLASAPRTRAWLLARVPASRRTEVERLQGEARLLFGRYIRGQLLLGLIIGTVSGIAYTLLGVPYAVFLGVLAGVLELVPIAGPIVAGAVAAVVSLTEPFPLVLWVIVAATLIQQLENHILVPRISGGAVGLHPLAALLAVLVGAEIGGVVGAIFAVPLTGFVWSVWLARQHVAPPPAPASQKS
jgi:predicted PurR-regulated permease PerM